MAKKSGWRKVAITTFSGVAVPLTTLEGYSITPKKLSYDAMQIITDDGGLNINPKDLEGKSEEEIKAVIEAATANKDGGKFSLSNPRFQLMLKTAFLEGVKSHNLDRVTDKNGVTVDPEIIDSMKDVDYNRDIKSGDLRVEILEWNEDLFEQMKDFTGVLFEIFQIVMEFNRPLEKVTSAK